MKEIHTAGLREFFYVLFWSVILFVLGRYTEYALPVFKMLSAVFTILIFCVFAFFVITRYSATFTYSLNGNVLRVNRSIGHRNKEIEMKISQIKEISELNPKIRPTYRLKKYILKNKLDCYITYDRGNGTECLLFAPSPQMLKKIKKSLKSHSSKKARNGESDA